MTDQTEGIRRLNDLARKAPQTLNASWMLTRGVLTLLAGGENGTSAAPLRAAERTRVTSSGSSTSRLSIKLWFRLSGA